MPKQFKKRSHKTGLPPGALVHIGEKWSEKAKISVMQYDENTLVEKELTEIHRKHFQDEATLKTWIHVDGIHDTTILEQMGEEFDLHPLLLEDILNTDHRPKMEDMGSYIFLVLKFFEADPGRMAGIRSEQISLVLGPNFVLSLQEKAGDLLNPVRERIRHSKGKIRKAGADYLAHAIIDTVIDSYFSVLETLGDEIEACEESLVNRPTSAILKTIQDMKMNMLLLRKAVWPLREAVSSLERTESHLIAESTNIYFRDVYDHTVQVMDTIETFRDSLSGMLDIYLSSLSNRMNEIMKVLTIIATIFIPLTFIAGVYGMNFEYMPELKWQGGYFIILSVMLAVALVMLKWFRKNKWL